MHRFRARSRRQTGGWPPAVVMLTALSTAACSGNGDAPLADGGATDSTAGSCRAGEPTCPPTPAPTWKLADFQPKSLRFGQTYGLDVFVGTPTFVALLSGW